MPPTLIGALANAPRKETAPMSPRRKTRSPLIDPASVSEATFQAQLLWTARANGWRIDVSDFNKSGRNERFFRNLEAVAPKGKVRRLLEYVLSCKDYIFSFGYHTWNSKNSQPGYFDVVLIHPRRGVMLLAELKKVGGYMSLEQRLWFAAAKCVEEASNGAVMVRLWKPTDWPEIVETLGGIDPYAE